MKLLATISIACALLATGLVWRLRAGMAPRSIAQRSGIEDAPRAAPPSAHNRLGGPATLPALAPTNSNADLPTITSVGSVVRDRAAFHPTPTPPTRSSTPVRWADDRTTGAGRSAALAAAVIPLQSSPRDVSELHAFLHDARTRNDWTAVVDALSALVAVRSR